jgi:hypothetical protein
MNHLDIGRLLYEFEVKYFDEYKGEKIGKWNSWVILRRPLYYYIFNKQLSGAQNIITKTEKKPAQYSLKSKVEYFLTFLYRFFSDIIHRPKKELVLLMPLTIGKVYKDENGKFTDIRMDPFIIYKAIKNYVYLETSDRGRFIKPAKIKPDLLGDGLFFPILIIKFFLKVIGRFSKLSTVYAELLNEYFQQNGIVFSIKPEEIRLIFIQYYSELLIYKLFFKLLKPGLAIFNDALFSGRMTAAVENNVKTVELQHGFIGNYKPDYYLSHKLNEIRSDIPVCTVLATFGEFHKENIAEPGFWQEDSIFNIGNFLIEVSRSKTINREKKNFTVLFPSQFNLFKESKAFLLVLNDYLKEDNIRLLIKSHPREPKENINWYHEFTTQNSGRISFYENEHDIYSLIEKADLVVGFDSTTLLEAVAIGVPVITLATNGLPNGIHSHLWTKRLESSIRVGINAVSAIEMIKRLKNDALFRRQWHAEVEKQGLYLYEPNYQQNIRSLIQKILK